MSLVKYNNIYDEYIFIPYKDSMNGDMCHIGNDMNRAAFVAHKIDGAVGFNTWGFVKFRLSLPLKDVYSNGNVVGIFIKKCYITRRGLYMEIVYPYKRIEVKILPCWYDDRAKITRRWNRMVPKDSPIYFTWNDYADYYIILNNTLVNDYHVPERSVVFQMEPSAHNDNMRWDISRYLDVRDKRYYLNTNDWLINLQYDDTWNDTGVTIYNKTRDLSIVMSDKNFDQGHIYRIALVRYIESKNYPIDIYGKCATLGYRQYKGELVDECKNDGLIPYYYSIAIENNSERNYATEKLWDVILAEAVPFYWGCPNVEDYIPEQAIIRLDNNIEQSYYTIIKSIHNHEYNKRIQYVLEAKTIYMMRYSFNTICSNIFLNLDYDPLLEHMHIADYRELDQRYMPQLIYRIRSVPDDWTLITLDVEPNENDVQIVPGVYKNNTSIIYSESYLYRNKPSNNTSAFYTDKSKFIDHVTAYKIVHSAFITNKEIENKVWCVNLVRRPDRKQKVQHELCDLPVRFFNAIDGKIIEPTSNLVYMFRHVDTGFKQGVIGCALSHIMLWKQLVNDVNANYYIIFEDDVEKINNYSIDEIVARVDAVNNLWNIIMLYYIRRDDEMIRESSSYRVTALNKNECVGSTAAYIISKRGATSILSMIDRDGVKHGIDYYFKLIDRVYNIDPFMYKSSWCQHLNDMIDTDIQKNNASIFDNVQC